MKMNYPKKKLIIKILKNKFNNFQIKIKLIHNLKRNVII